jgi:DNA-binding CsgD family transcriptional regulator
VKRPLTDRELEIMQLVADGLTLTQAAEKLGIARATARTHTGRVLIKLEASTQAHAVAILFRRRLIQ